MKVLEFMGMGIKLDSDSAYARDKALAARHTAITEKKVATLDDLERQKGQAIEEAVEALRAAHVEVATKREALEHALAADAHAVIAKLMPQFKSDKAYEAAPLLIKEVARLRARTKHELADEFLTAHILCQATADSQGLTSAVFPDEYPSDTAPVVIARKLASALVDEDEVAVVDQARRLLSAVRSKSFVQNRFFVARAARRWVTAAGRAGAISVAHAEEEAESVATRGSYRPLVPGEVVSMDDGSIMTNEARTRERLAEAAGGEVEAK